MRNFVGSVFARLFPTGWYFELLYLAVAIATFEHTAWAFGSLFLGTPETEFFSLSDPIWLRGGLLAMAIDIGLFLVARTTVEYSKQPNTTKRGYTSLIFSFAIIAVISFFAQLLFAYYHTPSIAVSAGVSDYWVNYLKGIIEGAPFVLAACLPVIASLFTFTRILLGKNHESLMAHQEATRVYRLSVDGKIKEYDTVAGVRRALTRYKNSGKAVEVMPESQALILG